MCESYAYMQPIVINSIVDHLKIGATGELLSQNIRNEWLYSNVTSRDESVYQFCNTDQQKYNSDILSKRQMYIIYLYLIQISPTKIFGENEHVQFKTHIHFNL